MQSKAKACLDNSLIYDFCVLDWPQRVGPSASHDENWLWRVILQDSCQTTIHRILWSSQHGSARISDVQISENLDVESHVALIRRF